MTKSNNRPPMRKKRSISTVPPPLISFGKHDKNLLSEINKQGVNFQRRAYCNLDLKNRPPSTVKNALDRLISKGMLEKVGWGTYVITSKGKNAIGELNKGVGGRQEACRGSDSSSRQSVSMHRIKFSLNVANDSFYDLAQLKKLGRYDGAIEMQNWVYHRLHIGNATMKIFPNKITGEITELLGNDSEKVLMLALDEVAELADKFFTIGLICDIINLDRAEFARVECILAETLVKRLGKYRYTMKNGRAYWIDFSGGKLEGETDDVKLAGRVDDLIEDLPNSKSLFSDVDMIQTDVSGLKKVAHMILQHDVNVIRMQQSVNKHNASPSNQEDMRNYFG